MGAADLSIVPHSQIFLEWKRVLLMDLSGKYTTLENVWFFKCKGSVLCLGISFVAGGETEPHLMFCHVLF